MPEPITEIVPPVEPSTTTTSSTSPTSPTFQPPLLPSPFNLTSPAPKLLTQGAEALVYLTHHLHPTRSAILKFRPSKAYRHPTLDARLTKQRVLAEARVLVKLSGGDVAASGVRVPAVLGLEWDVGRRVKGLDKESGVVVQRERERGDGGVAAAKGAWILMEYIEGKSVKELLRGVHAWVMQRGDDFTEEERRGVNEEVKSLLRRLGRAVGSLHAKGGVVHGDLTSSNVMVRPDGADSTQTSGMNGDTPTERQLQTQTEAETQQTSRWPSLAGEIVLIDFGLATQSVQDEDRAVDLYVLERAFGSTHPRQEGWFDAEVLQHQEGYRGSFKGSQVVLKRLEDVRMRGRKRSMIG